MDYGLADMKALDIYLSGLSQKKYNDIKEQIGVKTSKSLPLKSLGYHIENYHSILSKLEKRADVDQVLQFANQYQWHNDLKSIFNEHDFEALIVTDKYQKIIWVNDGFTEMTGYSKSFAKNKTPRFLQGEKTSDATKKRIRSKIARNEALQDVIINHRKDGSTYKCEVKIFPLYNESTTHFIALEKLVS